MSKKKLVLNEDDIEITNDFDLDAVKDEVNPLDVISKAEQDALASGEVIYDENGNVETEPEVPQETVVNAYSGLLQDLLRKQWDVINAADGIMATVDGEAADINKEDVKSILQKLVDETTVSIGMVTKALGVVDPSQEELMNKGVEKAEEVISDTPKEEPVEESVKPLKEDNSEEWKKVDFSDSDYYDRFWQEECFYQLQYYWENLEDYEDDEDIRILDVLSADEIKDIVIDAAEEVRNSDYLWEEINERIQDEIRDSISRKAEEIRNTPTVEIDLSNTEGE